MHFQEPVVVKGLGLGHVAIVSSPEAIRRVLVERRTSYRKDTFQRRVMSALGSGLLTAEGEQWHVQRRTLAPIFTRKAAMEFSPAMAQAADDLVERWRARDGEHVNVAADVTRLTLDVLERTIFSDGLGRDTEDVRAAMRVYLDSIGLFASLANRFMLAAAMPSTRQIAFWDKVLVPVSRVLDNVTGHKFGKSIVVVWAPL